MAPNHISVEASSVIHQILIAQDPAAWLQLKCVRNKSKRPKIHKILLEVEFWFSCLVCFDGGLCCSTRPGRILNIQKFELRRCKYNENGWNVPFGTYVMELVTEEGRPSSLRRCRQFSENNNNFFIFLEWIKNMIKKKTQEWRKGKHGWRDILIQGRITTRTKIVFKKLFNFFFFPLLYFNTCSF